MEEKDLMKMIQNVKSRLLELYGDQLIDVILFGSHARGEADKDSDIDIAVVLDKDFNKYEEIDGIVDVIYDISLENEELISVLPLNVNELKEGSSSIYENIRREGVVV